jgi:serine/threonine-protein kinase
MPYVDGESLRERLAREPRLPVEEALRVTLEVAGALAHAHARHLVHRDVKPGNILLSGARVFVADFGIARATDEPTPDELAAEGSSVGTPAYLSPEQAAGVEEVDGRSDLYSLGCVLYEMLAGRPPFIGATTAEIVEQQRSAEPPAIEAVLPEVPAGVSRLLRRLLAKAPDDRVQTAEELIEALRGAADAPSPAPRAAPSPAGRAARPIARALLAAWSRRGRARGVAACAACAG